MGLLRDRDAELTGLQRYVALVKEPPQRAALSAEEWPLAMLAYALHMSEDSDLFSEGLAAYADFVLATQPYARKQALVQLGRFVSSRQGKGWRALLLFAMGELAASELSAQAATLALSLAPSEQNQRFSGASALVHLLVTCPQAPPAMLNALLAPSDLRLLPLLAPLYNLPRTRAEVLLRGLQVTLNSLSSAFLLQLLEIQPLIAEEVTAALVRMTGSTSLVADMVYPIPVWAYAQPAPQPLHAWTLSEYLPRMRARLAPILTQEQMQRLEKAFT